ncbi:hypothetical protein GCM10023235_06260 [Kitasatospora terrestris]|uniref:Uncharacterized protein n=1 Tax=Kitasatospora terrestris TaxID=258051 RepID=A0ABP9DCK3_9ACTN
MVIGLPSVPQSASSVMVLLGSLVVSASVARVRTGFDAVLLMMVSPGHGPFRRSFAALRSQL